MSVLRDGWLQRHPTQRSSVPGQIIQVQSAVPVLVKHLHLQEGKRSERLLRLWREDVCSTGICSPWRQCKPPASRGWWTSCVAGRGPAGSPEDTRAIKFHKVPRATASKHATTGSSTGDTTTLQNTQRKGRPRRTRTEVFQRDRGANNATIVHRDDPIKKQVILIVTLKEMADE